MCCALLIKLSECLKFVANDNDDGVSLASRPSARVTILANVEANSVARQWLFIVYRKGNKYGKMLCPAYNKKRVRECNEMRYTYQQRRELKCFTKSGWWAYFGSETGCLAICKNMQLKHVKLKHKYMQYKTNILYIFVKQKQTRTFENSAQLD